MSSSSIRVQVLEASFVVTANQWQCAGSASGECGRTAVDCLKSTCRNLVFKKS